MRVSFTLNIVPTQSEQGKIGWGIMNLKFLSGTLICLSMQAFGGVVGDFTQTRNLPGYIDLNPKSEAFRGPRIQILKTNDGIITETPSELIAKFMSSGRINTQKIQSIISEIEIYRENARIAYCQTEQAEDGKTQQGCKDGFPREKLIKKWEQKDVNIALKYAITRLEEAIELAPSISPANINTKEAQDFLEAFFDGVEIYQSVVAEDQQMGRNTSIPGEVLRMREGLRPMVITKNRVESANLVRKDDNGNSVFYSPEELADLKRSGFDISKLDPIDSGFWRKPKDSISKYDTTNYSHEEMQYFKKELSKDEIDELLDANKPIEVSYRIYTPKGTGETPKIFVEYGKSTFKVKFTTDRIGDRDSLSVPTEAIKIMRGMEINTETLTNNLAAALGFTVDGTYYKNVIKVFFKDEIYEQGLFESEYARMKEILTTRYGADYNAGSALQNVKVDPKTGRKYIELKHCQLERKTGKDTDMGIGFFIRKGLGKSLKREHRAFALFLAWVWDLDTKDNNNGMKLVPFTDEMGRLRYKVVMSNTDMGATLASNRPNIFNFRLVRQSQKDANGEPEYIRLNYYRIYPNDLIDAVTFDDAKWFGRMLAQLSYSQIYKAAHAAGYPEVVARYYTLMLLKKRNQLLDALGLMGETFANDFGQSITIEKAPEFTGTIAGFEKFFREGQLTDPNNELFDPARDPFPRYWGSGRKNFNGEPQEAFYKLLKLQGLTTAGNIFYNSFLRNMSLSNQGFQFRDMVLADLEEAQECSGKCFFQGFNAGVEGLIPWRFIVENPDKESRDPYLLVDVFRLGFFLGYSLESKFGLQLPNGIAMGLGAKNFQISEFIKIRPIKSLDEFYREGSDLLKMPKLKFKTARQQVIDNLQEGEILIQSHYIGLKAFTKMQLGYTKIIPIAPSIILSGNLMTANRVTFFANGGNKMLVGWENLKQLSARLSVNLVDMVIRLPILELELKKLKKVDRTFIFDRTNSEDRRVMLGSLNKIVPSQIPEKYSLELRSTKSRERNFSLGFPFFYHRNASRRTVHVDYENYVEDRTASNVSYIRDITRSRATNRLGQHKYTYTVQASINSEDEVFAKVKLDGEFQNMNKYKFKNVLLKFGDMLPPNFVQFDPASVKQNFGLLEMNIETIFGENALRRIFNPNVKKYGFCRYYAKIQKLNWTDKTCTTLARMRSLSLRPRQIGINLSMKRFHNLWRRYEGARIAFGKLMKIKSQGFSKANSEKLLEKIGRFIEDTDTFEYQTMNLLIGLSKKEDYYRTASLYSKLESFPGGKDFIGQDVTVQGNLEPSILMLADSPVEEFEIFSDKFHKLIRSVFYSEQLFGSTIQSPL